MRTTAEYRRGFVVMALALWALAPARSGLAQVTSSTSLPAATTTSTTALVTSTSTTVPTGTTLEPSSTTTTEPLVVLPNSDPFFTIAPDTSLVVGPTFTATIFATITTVVDLPFSTGFSRATTTTIRLETIAFSTTTTEPATTTTTTPTTSTAAPATRLEIATGPAPATGSSEPASSSGAWTVLAGVALVAGAGVAWRRLRGAERG